MSQGLEVVSSSGLTQWKAPLSLPCPQPPSSFKHHLEQLLMYVQLGQRSLGRDAQLTTKNAAESGRVQKTARCDHVEWEGQDSSLRWK
jgi:hypothetical protein